MVLSVLHNARFFAGRDGLSRETRQDLGVTVLGLSVDSPYVNVKFAEETGAPFPILSDFNREAIRAYCVVRKELGGLLEVADRSVFVVDSGGVVSWTWQGEHPGMMPPFAEIIAAVRRAGAGAPETVLAGQRSESGRAGT